MGLQDTFADAVMGAKQKLPPIFEGAPGPQPVTGPGMGPGMDGQLPPMGGAPVVVNVGQPAPPPSAPPSPEQAAYQGQMGQMQDQEAQRQAFASSLTPEVSQAFASFMDGIAEQEALKQMSAPGAARLFGA